MVKTRGLRRRQSSRPKSVATPSVKSRSTVKPSPPLANLPSVKPSPPLANLKSKANTRKGHGTRPPSLRRRPNSSPQICEHITELSSSDDDVSDSTSVSFTDSHHESQDHDEYTSAAPSVSSSDDEVDEANNDAQVLPRRLFCTDRYPTEGRVNQYSKPQYLVDILSVLEGSVELRKLMQSPFSSLFELPVRRCLLSSKLVHNFLSRQLVTKNSDELWFTFGGYPLRFSLPEFEKVTGLRCGPYPDKDTVAAAQTPSDPKSAYWYTLVGPEKEITIDAIVKKLKSEPTMPGWRKLALSLIVIVEGVLIYGTQPIKATFPIVEMVKDLDFFYSYPWGRHSFEHTIRMVTVGKQVRRQSLLVKKMKQDSLVLHGFPLAIQLMIFQSVPLLLRYLPSADDVSSFYDRTLTVLPKLKTYHTHNILHVENDRELHVTHTVAISSDGRENSNVGAVSGDAKVAYMVKLIEEGYKFSKMDWRGGDESLERLCICNKKKHGRCKCGSSLPTDENGIPTVRSSHSAPSATAEIATLRAQISVLEKKNESMNLKLKNDLLSEMRAMFASQKCCTCESNSRAPEHVSPLRNSTVVPPGFHTPSTPNFGNPTEFDENQGFASEFDPCNHQPSSEVQMEDVGDDNNHGFPGENNEVRQVLPSLAVSDGVGVSDFKVGTTSHTSMSSPVPPLDSLSLETSRRSPIHADVASEVLPSSVSRNGVDVADRHHTRPVLHRSKPHIQKPLASLVLGLAPPGFTKSALRSSSYSKAACLAPTVGGVPSVPLNSHLLNVPPSACLPTHVGVGKDDESNFCGDPVNNNHTPTVCSPCQEPHGRLASSLELSYVVIPPAPRPLPDIASTKCPLSNTPTVDSSRKRTSVPFVPPRIFTESKPFKKPKIVHADHIPFTDVDPFRIKRFKRKMRSYNKDSYDIDGVPVSKNFFKDIYTPQKWLFRTHLDCMIRPFWRKKGAFLASNGIVVHDTLFTQLLCAQYITFGSPTKSPTYVWDSELTSYVEGGVGDRVEVTKWFGDVHTIYAPMNWGNRHWVGLLICLRPFHVEILDPYVICTSDEEVASYMKPFMKMLPLLIKETCDPADITHLEFLPFTYDRLERVPQSTRGGDCGPFALKLIEMHSHSHSVQGLGDIPDDVVDMFQMQYAIDVYEEFVAKIDV